jgi:Haem-binding domain
MRRKILWSILIIGLIAQAFQPDRSAPVADPAKHLEHIAQVPGDVSIILAKACYDCHSDTTRYPWYSYITPVNFWQQDHINEGRRKLDFSAWGGYTHERMAKILKKIKHEVSEGDMPLPSYTWMHGDARLGEEERKLLVGFFENLP